MVDLASLSHEEIVALRDKLLALAPLDPPPPPMSNVERQAAAAKARFDAINPDTGAVAGLLREIAERKEWHRVSTANGRFFVESYDDARGRLRWRVMDRYLKAVALFSLDGLKMPKRHEGYRTQEHALATARHLEEYYLSIQAWNLPVSEPPPVEEAPPEISKPRPPVKLLPYHAQQHQAKVDGKYTRPWRVKHRGTGEIATIRGNDGQIITLHHLPSFEVAQQYCERLSLQLEEEQNELQRAA